MKYRIAGNTFEWKKELKGCGLRWNAQLRVWEGNKLDHINAFTQSQVEAAIESGELKNIAADSNELAYRTVSQYGRY